MFGLVSVLCLTQSTIASVDAANRMASKLVRCMNDDDAKGLEALALPEFFRAIPEERLQGLVDQVHSLGHLSEPTLVLDLGEQRQYRMKVSHEEKPDREILMVLGAESESKFYSLNMGAYVAPGENFVAPLTDNRLASPEDKSVDAAVQTYWVRHNPVGMSIGILDGDLKTFYNYGETTLGSKHVPTSSTIYEIGSITKTMTGLLVSRAVQDGKLDLDADIRSYLPGKYPNLEFKGSPVLLRNLVTHTSGLPGNPPGIPDEAGADAYEKYNHETLLADLGKVSLPAKPGTAFSYSNMGAGLCGPILEKAYGMSYLELLKKFVFGPAKMSESGFALTPQMAEAFATPYDAARKKTDPWIVNGIEAAGAVRSSAADMLRYAHLNEDENNPIVKRAHTSLIEIGGMNMGIFWILGDSRLGGHYVNHEGGTGGFSTHILVFPARKLSVVVLMNSGEQNAGDLAYEIALRLLYKP